MNIKGRFGWMLLGWCGAISAHAAEVPVKIAPGQHAALVQSYCSICHSLDYIVMNSLFLSRTAWEGEVRKMMKIMGAPVPDSDVAPIVDYLTQNYGVK
ncbi:MAG: hypothetical protein WA807_14060 [Steroidobacteraceae bacterium]